MCRELACLNPALLVSMKVCVTKMADFLPSRSFLSVCFPKCLLNTSEAEQLRISKEIDRCISKDKTYVKRLVKILLLGAGESGKSTFLKQMRIIHGQDFDQLAREEFRATIYSNVIKGGSELAVPIRLCFVLIPLNCVFVAWKFFKAVFQTPPSSLHNCSVIGMK